MAKQKDAVATVVRPRSDEPLDQRWERMWQAIDRIRARNEDKDPDAELAFITEEIEAVRRERYERELREAESRR